MNVDELKVQADYYATYVSRIQEEITKEDAKVTAAAGTEDADVVEAEAKEVKEWYTHELDHLKE